jgi:excisionase family DNA binding protein
MQVEFFSTRKAAEYLGVHIKTVYYLRKHNKIQAYLAPTASRKIYRFRREDLDRLMQTPDIDEIAPPSVKTYVN